MRAGVMLAFSFMNIHTAAQYMQHGYRVRREAWIGRFPWKAWIDKDHIVGFYFHYEDLLADDWEIIHEGIISDFGEIEYELLPYQKDEDEE